MIFFFYWRRFRGNCFILFLSHKANFVVVAFLCHSPNQTICGRKFFNKMQFSYYFFHFLCPCDPWAAATLNQTASAIKYLHFYTTGQLLMGACKYIFKCCCCDTMRDHKSRPTGNGGLYSTCQ